MTVERDGTLFTGIYAERVLENERRVLEEQLKRTSRLMVVMWRDLMTRDPDYNATVDAYVFDLQQETKDCPIGTCARCACRAPLTPAEHMGRPIEVCVWGCDD